MAEMSGVFHETQTASPRRRRFLPCADHHQVVQEARARFLFLHLGPSRRPGPTFPLESVAPSHRSWGEFRCEVERQLLDRHRESSKTCDARKRDSELFEVEMLRCNFPPVQIPPPELVHRQIQRTNQIPGSYNCERSPFKPLLFKVAR